MKITDIEAIPFHLPIRRDFAWAGLSVGIGRFVLVRVRTDDSLMGLGEAVPLAEWGGDHNRRAGETQRTVNHVVEDLLQPHLVGEDPLDIERLGARMDAVVRGHSYAKAAIDMALHDLLGKAAGLPLYKVLGGAFRESVPIAHMLGLMPIEDAIEEGSAAVADGVPALQVKGGVDPVRDEVLIRGLRERLGPDVWLRLDPNQGYGDVASAVKILREIEPLGLDFVEQPVAGVRRLAKVRRSIGVPIIADESCWDAQDAMECVELDAVDAISIYLAKAGGIAGARRVAAVAHAAGLPCDVNGSIESGVGNAANVHFALATPAVSLPCVIPVTAPTGAAPYPIAGHYYEDDIVTRPFAVDGGALLPPDGPGLGVEIDEDKLEAFRDDLDR
jgi:L-alanine-DL-glutamate epimerase-like enolase superfamily enzyme